MKNYLIKNKNHYIFIDKNIENSKLLLNRETKLSFREKLIYFSETKTGFLFLSIFSFFIYPMYYYFLYFEHKTFSDKFYDKQKQIDFAEARRQEKIDNKVREFGKKIIAHYKNNGFQTYLKKKISKTTILTFGLAIMLTDLLFKWVQKFTVKKPEQSMLFTNKNYHEDEDEFNKDIEDTRKRRLDQKLKKENVKKSKIEFDPGYKLRKSLKEEFEQKWRISNKNYDFFILGMFFISYLFISVITLGIFPIYQIKRGWFNKNEMELLNTKKQSDYLSLKEFKEKINGLTNNIGPDFDYSSSIISSVNNDLRTQNAKIIFKTKIFKEDIYKFLIILALMIFTGGMFGIYLISKNTYNSARDLQVPITLNNEKNIETIGKHFESKNKAKLALKAIYDFGYDVKIASKLVTNRKSITQSNIKISPSTKKDYFYLFIKSISSPIFKWLFSIFLLIGVITSVCMWIVMESAIIPSVWFITFIFLLLFLILGLSYHIFLLF